MDSKKLRYSLSMLIGIIALGTCGYYFVEHMPLFEAFYMTIITISTVGFAEVIPLSQAGRAITVIIIILGISVGAYTIGVLVRALVEGELVQILGRRKVQKQVSGLKNHFIICGFGRIGRLGGRGTGHAGRGHGRRVVERLGDFRADTGGRRPF